MLEEAEVWCGAGVPVTIMFFDGFVEGWPRAFGDLLPPAGLSGILEIQTRCLLARAHMSTNTDSDLSPEVLSRLLILCNHPQVQGYRRGPRGRRGAIYISADENLSTTAISSFSASSVLEIDPIRRNSFSG